MKYLFYLFYLFLILYSFPVLQMGNRVASTSAGSSSADSQPASPKALFPTASQVRSSMPALLWQPAALQLACTQLCIVCLWCSYSISFANATIARNLNRVGEKYLKIIFFTLSTCLCLFYVCCTSAFIEYGWKKLLYHLNNVKNGELCRFVKWASYFWTSVQQSSTACSFGFVFLQAGKNRFQSYFKRLFCSIIDMRWICIDLNSTAYSMSPSLLGFSLIYFQINTKPKCFFFTHYLHTFQNLEDVSTISVCSEQFALPAAVGEMKALRPGFHLLGYMKASALTSGWWRRTWYKFRLNHLVSSVNYWKTCFCLNR